MNKKTHIAVLVLALSLFGCGGGGGGETPAPADPGSSADTTAPSVSTQSPTGRLITTGSSISLTFNESIDTSSFTLAGNLAEESDGGVWNQTDVIDDTLTITPTTNWSVDTGRTLVINAKDLAGNAIAELTLTHDVYRGTLYYISAAMPDDTANGETPATARKFIHAAVADVTAPATILVAEGEYRLSSAATHQTQVVLKEGVSLYGGYNADFTQRDPTDFISRIVDRSTDAGTVESPNRAVEGDASITALTIIDGFTIDGSTQAGSENNSGISLYGSSPTVQNNTLNGGSGSNTSMGMYNRLSASPTVHHNTLNGGSGLSSIGIYNDSASPIVKNNTIHGGSGGITSTGMGNSNSSPTVQNNTIDGGSGGDTSTGMRNSNSSPTVQGNTLNGGSGDQSYGTYNFFASPSVQNNTIHGGSGGYTTCGMYNANSSPTVQNNTISGGSGDFSYGMINHESSPTVQHNTLNGGSGDQSLGMRNSTFSSPTVQDNIINGGSGSLNSTGMHNASSSPTVQSNTIHGGSGGIQTFGMLNANSTLTIINNIIHGGDDSDESRGIQSTNAELFIQNNTIHGGSGVDESWAISNSSTYSVIDNNILIAGVSGSSICYQDFLSAPDSMKNNDFVGCTVLYRISIYTELTTIAEVNALPGAGNNISVDPLFVDQEAGNYHFSASSPASVTAGGLNGVDEDWGFSDDKDGISRPAAGSAWAMGAYEPN